MSYNGNTLDIACADHRTFRFAQRLSERTMSEVCIGIGQSGLGLLEVMDRIANLRRADSAISHKCLWQRRKRNWRHRSALAPRTFCDRAPANNEAHKRDHPKRQILRSEHRSPTRHDRGPQGSGRPHVASGPAWPGCAGHYPRSGRAANKPVSLLYLAEGLVGAP